MDFQYFIAYHGLNYQHNYSIEESDGVDLKR